MEQPQEVTTDAIQRAREQMVKVREQVERRRYEPALAIFAGLHPVDQAALLAELGRQQQRGLLVELSAQESAQIMEQMEPQEAATTFGFIQAPLLSNILDEAPPDVAADILKLLPEDRSLEALEGMEEPGEVTPLMEYPDESAGGIMTTQFVSIRDDITAANALDSVRILGELVEDIGSILIVDSQRRLVGSLSLVRLALARPGTLVQEIMEAEIISASAVTDQEECATLMERYDLRHLPVVDDQRRLLGVILVEDLVDVIEEEATEDMYNMAGISGERLFGPLRSSARRRLPWLFLNLGTTLLSALVISFFEDTIVRVVALAVFLPVIAGQGGIGGTQTLTLLVRSIALGDVPRRRVLRLLRREILLGLINGILLGVAIGVLAYAWKGVWMLGVVLGVAMLGNMIVAGLTGVSTPLILRRLRLDPALGSAVIVTTVTDTAGFLMFLGMAAALVSFLD